MLKTMMIRSLEYGFLWHGSFNTHPKKSPEKLYCHSTFPGNITENIHFVCFQRLYVC